MTFNSLPFACFLVALLSLFALFRGELARKRLLLAAGVLFYGWWNWRFLALIGFTSVFDFLLGQAIGRARGRARKWLLVADIVVNLGLLITFKYCNFFIESCNAWLGSFGLHFRTLNILLPLGISFFVFEAMSYCIDIYRGRMEPYRSWLDFGLFIFFFPRMIAGPIIRASDFLPQIAQRRLSITHANANRAACIFLLGLVKKVLVADRLALFVDPIFARPELYDSATTWAAVVAYAIQIFCDFSGYTDMAIALAKLFDIDLPINFDLPYLSASITEFWRRWHISLSSWLRDYLYISLGGNRRGRVRTYANLFLTMVLGGLWHGASWNFVVWGALHGGALALHKLIGVRSEPRAGVSRVLATVGTFGLVCVGWVFFRQRDLGLAWLMIRKLAFVGGPGLSWVYTPFWGLAPLALAWHLWRRGRNEHDELPLLSFRGWALIWAVAYLLWFGAPVQSQPFIYFQF